MRKILLIILLTSLFSISYADIGPKPTVSFHIRLDGADVPDEHFYAAMLNCYNLTSAGLEEVRNHTDVRHPRLLVEEYDESDGCIWYPDAVAWGGDCWDSRCSFNYFPPTHFRLAVYVPSVNKTFLTEDAMRESFDSRFDVELFSNGTTKISEVNVASGIIANFVIALIATVVIELIFSFVYIKWRKLPQKILISVVIANLLSVTLLWLALPVFEATFFFLCCLPFVFAEFAVMLLESLVIFLMNRKSMKIQDAFLMSLVNNLATSLIWVLLLFTSIFGL